ncbi:alcohol dehydrogenase catalytic domain-containing protein, partial [Rhodococcus oxybenzonivorans]
MRASVLVEPGRIEIRERAVPTPAPGDVLVQVSSVGVCGSDAHYYREGRIG